MRQYALALCVTTVVGGINSGYAKNIHDIEGQRRVAPRLIPLMKSDTDQRRGIAFLGGALDLKKSSTNSHKRDLSQSKDKQKSLRKYMKKDAKLKRKIAKSRAKAAKKLERLERRRAMKAQKIRDKMRKKYERKLRKQQAHAMKLLRKKGINLPALVLEAPNEDKQTSVSQYRLKIPKLGPLKIKSVRQANVDPFLEEATKTQRAVVAKNREKVEKDLWGIEEIQRESAVLEMRTKDLVMPVKDREGTVIEQDDITSPIDRVGVAVDHERSYWEDETAQKEGMDRKDPIDQMESIDDTEPKEPKGASNPIDEMESIDGTEPKQPKDDTDPKDELQKLAKEKLAKMKKFDDENMGSNDEVDLTSVPLVNDHYMQVIQTQLEEAWDHYLGMEKDKESPDFLSLENFEKLVDGWEAVGTAQSHIDAINMDEEDERSRDAVDLKIKLLEIGGDMAASFLELIDELQSYLNNTIPKGFISDESAENPKTAGEILEEIQEYMQNFNNKVEVFRNMFENLLSAANGSLLMQEFPNIDDIFSQAVTFNTNPGVQGAIDRLEFLKRRYLKLAAEEKKADAEDETPTLEAVDDGEGEATPEISLIDKDEKKEEAELKGEEEDKRGSVVLKNITASIDENYIKESLEDIEIIKRRLGSLPSEHTLETNEYKLGTIPNWYKQALSNLQKEVLENLGLFAPFKEELEAISESFSWEELGKLIAVGKKILSIDDVELKDALNIKVSLTLLKNNISEYLRGIFSSPLVSEKMSSEKTSSSLDRAVDSKPSSLTSSIKSSSRLEVNAEQMMKAFSSIKENLKALQHSSFTTSSLKPDDRSFLASFYRQVFADLSTSIDSNSALQSYKTKLEKLSVKGDEDFSFEKLAELAALGNQMLELGTKKLSASGAQFGDLYYMNQRAERIQLRLNRLVTENKLPTASAVSTSSFQAAPYSSTFKVYEENRCY